MEKPYNTDYNLKYNTEKDRVMMNSIADELRTWAEGGTLRGGMSVLRARDQLFDIAARIDATHKVAVKTAYEDGLHKGQADAIDADWLKYGWVRGPIGADGEPMANEHTVVDKDGSVGVIVETRFNDNNWFVLVDFGKGRSDRFVWFLPKSLTHYHVPTVEDVLREFADEMNQNLGMYTGEAIDADEWRQADSKTIAEYAKRLTLAEGED